MAEEETGCRHQTQKTSDVVQDVKHNRWRISRPRGSPLETYEIRQPFMVRWLEHLLKYAVTFGDKLQRQRWENNKESDESNDAKSNDFFNEDKSSTTQIWKLAMKWRVLVHCGIKGQWWMKSFGRTTLKAVMRNGRWKDGKGNGRKGKWMHSVSTRSNNSKDFSRDAHHTTRNCPLKVHTSSPFKHSGYSMPNFTATNCCWLFSGRSFHRIQGNSNQTYFL